MSANRALLIETSGQTFTVNIDGPKAYTDSGLTTVVTMPATVSTDTVWYFAARQPASASGNATTVTVTKPDGTVMMQDFALPRLPATVDCVEGTVEGGIANPQLILNATYQAPDVICAVATGTAATDTAALQAAINATPKGGTCFIKGHYKINAVVTIPDHMTLLGDGIAATSEGASVGGDPSHPISPFLAGTIIEQTVAATDAVQITGSGKSVHLKSFGVLFTAGLASTGHGVNATTTVTYTGEPDLGVVNYTWEDVYVYGHDGNHFGFVRTNCLNGSTRNLRAWGGGGFLTECNHASLNCGNDVNLHPFCAIINSGTAGGYVNKSRTNGGNGGFLNLIVNIRPQVMASASMAQRAWDDLSGAGIPQQITCVGVDFEGGAAGIRKASSTKFIGDRYVTVTPTNEIYTDPGALNALVLAGNNFLAPPAGLLSTFNFSNGEMRMAPLYVPRQITVTSLGIEVTTGGSTGAVIRFGIYNSDPVTGAPTTLALDAGTAAATGTGVIQVTGLSTVLQPGLYWLGTVNQGAPTTTPTVRYIGEGNTPVAFSSFPTGSNAVMQTFLLTAITGALPASPSWSGPVSQTPPYTILGYSA